MRRNDDFKKFEEAENAKVVSWVRSFCQEASETSFSLLTLMSAGFAASVLKDGGFRLHKPVALVLPCDEVVDEVGQLLSIFPKRLLSTNTIEKTVHKQLKCGHDDIYPFIFQKGGNTERCLDIIGTATLSGYAERTPFEAVSAVLFTGVIPKEERDRFSVIIDLISQDTLHVPTWEGKASMKCLLKSFLTTRWRSCMGRIHRHLRELQETSSDFKVLLAAGLMLEEALRWADADAELLQNFHEKMVSAIMRTEEITEQYGEKEAMARIFTELLRSEVEEGQLRLTTLSTLQEATLGEVTLPEGILEDDHFYYLSDAVFRKVCHRMPFASQANIKQALAEAGVLSTEGQGRIYMTKKLKVNGLANGKRFIWLKKAAIDMIGKLSLTELGGKNDGEI